MARRLKIGEQFYLQGYKTKVEVISPNCGVLGKRYARTMSKVKILERAPTSKFQCGEEVSVLNAILYPRQDR